MDFLSSIVLQGSSQRAVAELGCCLAFRGLLLLLILTQAFSLIHCVIELLLFRALYSESAVHAKQKAE